MKSFICSIVTLFILITSISTALGVGFDISTFERDAEKYSVFKEDGSVFIEVNLSAQERDFSHKYNSKYYYNSIFPNIIILDAGKENEVAIPRVWINYRTEEKALNIKNVEFSIYNSRFNFVIEDSNITALEKGTISEEFVILIDKQCVEEFLGNWWYAATSNKPIKVRLIGNNDTIEFEMPLKVAEAGMELFWSYALNVKNASPSILDYSGTPVTISAEHQPLSEGIDMTYHDVSNGMSFTVPSGWAVVENDDDNSDCWTSAKVRWESTDKKKHVNIRYSAFDMYASMRQEGYSEIDIGGSRRELNNSFITKADFVEMMGLSLNEVEYEKYGNYEYYTYIQTQTDIIQSIEVTSTLKRYYNFDNGIMYCFSFAGEESKFDDFERILTSVKHEY